MIINATGFHREYPKKAFKTSPPLIIAYSSSVDIELDPEN